MSFFKAVESVEILEKTLNIINIITNLIFQLTFTSSGENIDEFNLRSDFGEKSNFDGENAMRSKENFNDSIKKKFKDVQPNIKKKFDP